MKGVTLLLLVLLAGCTRQAPEPALAIDHCALTEYREECDFTAGDEETHTAQDLQACYTKAEAEAMRIQAGIPAECMRPGAAARVW